MRIFTPALVAAALVVTGAAIAPLPARAAETLSSVPSNSFTVTKYYKQSVYDTAKDKIGSVDDVIVNDNGQVTGFMVGVGGFLGAGEKDVAVPFTAVRAEMKDGQWYLTLNATKDALKSAPGFTFDKGKTAWVPAKS